MFQRFSPYLALPDRGSFAVAGIPAGTDWSTIFGTAGTGGNGVPNAVVLAFVATLVASAAVANRYPGIRYQVSAGAFQDVYRYQSTIPITAGQTANISYIAGYGGFSCAASGPGPDQTITIPEFAMAASDKLSGFTNGLQAGDQWQQIIFWIANL